MTINKISIFAIIIVVIGVVFAFHYNHWSMKEINNTTIEVLPHPISTVKEGLKYAQQRADKWRKDAMLSSLVILSEGRNYIEKKGFIVRYGFFVKNKNILGLPYVVCWVDIDFLQQAIVGFRAFGGENLDDRPMNILHWKIEVDYVLSHEVVLNELNKHDNPRLVIRTNELWWEVAVYPSLKEQWEEISITFDAKTKRILKTRTTN